MASARYAAPAVDFVSAFGHAASEVVDAVAASDMGAPVAACPGWSTYDLVEHLGNVHAWAATILETGRRAPRQDDRPRTHRPRAVARWYAGKAEDLLQVLRTADPDRPCWTFAPGDTSARFWLRRQAHETHVHLVDLHQAAGRTTDVAAAVAADGIAEVLEVFLPRMHARGKRAALEAPLLLHAEDTGDTWLLTPADDAAPQARLVSGTDLVERDADLVAGPASDLMLLLWKRRPADHPALRLDGDPARLRAFLHSPLTP